MVHDIVPCGYCHPCERMARWHLLSGTFALGAGAVACLKGVFLGGWGGAQMYEKRGGAGSRTQKYVYQKWPISRTVRVGVGWLRGGQRLSALVGQRPWLCVWMEAPNGYWTCRVKYTQPYKGSWVAALGALSAAREGAGRIFAHQSVQGGGGGGGGLDGADGIGKSGGGKSCSTSTSCKESSKRIAARGQWGQGARGSPFQNDLTRCVLPALVALYPDPPCHTLYPKVFPIGKGSLDMAAKSPKGAEWTDVCMSTTDAC